RDADAELVAQALGGGEGGVVRIEHDLRQARAVAQVDEDDPAVVAAAVHPAIQSDSLAEMVAANLAGVAGTHCGMTPRCCVQREKVTNRRPGPSGWGRLPGPVGLAAPRRPWKRCTSGRRPRSSAIR